MSLKERIISDLRLCKTRMYFKNENENENMNLPLLNKNITLGRKYFMCIIEKYRKQ